MIPSLPRPQRLNLDACIPEAESKRRGNAESPRCCTLWIEEWRERTLFQRVGYKRGSWPLREEAGREPSGPYTHTGFV